MARTVKEQEYTKKRNDILDAAQRLIYSKGYERLTIRDILADLRISGGAFYHYFDSKQAVMVALAARMQDDLEQCLQPIIKDNHLSATDKLQRAIATILRRDISKQAETLIITLLRAWFSDENALVRAKVDEGRQERFAPLLTEIVRQGIREASFTPTRPELSGELILSLIQGLQYSLARFYSTFEIERNQQQFIEGSVAAFDAYMEAIERMLGAPSRLLFRLNAETVKQGLAIGNEIASRHHDS
jgi:AcrR family transcriptional regulator